MSEKESEEKVLPFRTSCPEDDCSVTFIGETPLEVAKAIAEHDERTHR